MVAQRQWLTVATVLLLCTAATVLAQSEESTLIVQTSDMSFLVTGSATSNFSNATQAKFSDQLRAVLQSYNFMSVSVNDYSAKDGYVDVSVRAVDATTAENLTATWSDIAEKTLVKNTFMPAFNSLLTNDGIQANATLTAASGVTAAAGYNVTFLVDMTLSGGTGLQPFNDTKQQIFLTPMKSFLGDHGDISLASSKDVGNQVNVTLNVTLDANTIPQFWFFVANQSALQSNLPELGGSNLQITLDGYQVLGSVSTTQAQAPSSAAPPPVSSSQAQGTVTAAQASGASNTPPVASSASGTVTMSLNMTLYGSAIQPFTSDVQFAAASSMAGVFWIVVGTGSVQLASFQHTTATSQPPSTAKGSTPQYGRKLLQASAPAPGPSTVYEAENVVFTITLPSASQNSLLVLQQSSDVVRQQFAGWFVTQMQARGYTVDADVNSVAVSAVKGAAPAATSSSSTNVGAITGGVVGGVCGLALVALLAMWLVFRRQRKRDLAEKQAAKERDADDFKYWSSEDPRDSIMYTKDATTLKHTIITSLSNEGLFLNSKTPIYRSPLYSRVSELSSTHVDDVKKLLNKRKELDSAPLTDTSEQQAAALLSVLSDLEPGSLYYNKYVVEHGQRRAANSIIATARIPDSDQKVVIKFVQNHDQFLHEKLFYENRQALEGEEAHEYLPMMLDAFSGSPVIDTLDLDEVPPALVLERGNFTLEEWLSGEAVSCAEGKAEEVDRQVTLWNICKAVEYLHARSLVHGGLSPDAFLWFANVKRWKVMSFTNWARSHESMGVNYNLRYAAPELLLADLAGMKSIVAHEATDMWALGCIAFELLAGREIFGSEYNDEEVMSMLLGFVKLPWEENAEFFTDNLPPTARNFVADLLHRSPEARKPIKTALSSPLFTAENPAMANGASLTQTLRTPKGIMSTESEWTY